MLNVLQHKKVGEITVVVSRYFGGVKLGAGGLVRAYSTSVQIAMDALTLRQVIATTTAEIHFPFALENQVRHILEQCNIKICDVSYAEQGKILALIPLQLKDAIQQQLYDKTHGKVKIIYPIHI